MSYSLEHSFVIKAPQERVWSFLTDPARVASALPGATITEKVSDDAYNGTLTMKVGPVSARYRGTVRFEELDVAHHTAKIVASGQDTGGRGGADMKMSSHLTERSANETEVSMSSELSITGLLAQFGRGMIQDVSNQLFGRFSDAMRAQLEGPAVAPVPPDLAEPAMRPVPAAQPPIEVLSFGSGVLGRAVRRTVQKPMFWVAVVSLAAVVAWIWYWAR
jgi:uncharacterized protein